MSRAQLSARERTARFALFVAVLLGAIAATALGGCGSSGGGGGAGTFVPTDPSVAGRFEVEHGTAELTVPGYGAYEALTFRPVASDSAATAKAAAPPARVPGIVLSNGLAASGSIMTWISDHLASHGYAVLTFTPANTFSLDITTWAAGFTTGVAALLGEAGAASGDAGALADVVDPEQIGLVALSAGGAGAIQAAGDDPRVGAVVAFAPGINDLGRFLFQDVIDAAARVAAPTQIQVGTEDCLVNPRPPSLLAFTNLGRTSVETYYDAIPARRQFLEITGADHVGYFDADAAERWVAAIVDLIPIDCAPTISATAQHTVAQKYATMWLDTYLYGSDAWQDALFGSGVAADLESGLLTRERADGPASG